jgi:hypothetical protein
MSEPFKMTMSESYARHRKLIPGDGVLSSNENYYLILGPPRKDWLERLRRMAEEEKEGVLPFRFPARPASNFAPGFDAEGRRVDIYRPGDVPSSAKGKVKFIGTLEVRRYGVEEGMERLRVHFQKFDPYLNSRESEEFFTLDLREAKRLGLVIQDLDGFLRQNPEMTHVFVSEAYPFR